MSATGPWACFHCGETFADEGEARQHFGVDEDSRAACIVKGEDGGLLRAYREAERDALDAWTTIHSESAAALRSWRRAEARHARMLVEAEQRGYDRGVADCRAEAADK